MVRLSLPIRVWGVVLGVIVLLTMNGMGQAKSQATQGSSLESTKPVPQTQPADIPLCTGASSGRPAGQVLAQVSAHPHSVTLSWNATVPASNSPRDAIKGYDVYRSLTSHTYAESNRISESALRGTRCVDTTVEPRKTYFYVVKAVTESGKHSGSSIEIKAVVPFP
jgi:hypothetical protein